MWIARMSTWLRFCLDTYVGQIAAQFLEKVKLIASIHENVLLNVEHAQKRQ